MWTSTLAASGVVAGGVALAVAYRRRSDPPLSACALSCDLQRARSASDVVRLLQRLARRATTEDIAVQLAGALEQDGIDEAVLVRLSRLHRLHGEDNGATGYALNMVWGIVLQGVADGTVVIYAD